MGTAILRQWLTVCLLAAGPMLGCVAGENTRQTVQLESEARAEFDRAGAALRERLEKEAQGDLIGAGIAAREADAHRYRYLDLKREIEHRHPAPAPAPSVAALRDPFVPDASVLSVRLQTVSASSPTAVGSTGTANSDPPRVWDMYRSRAFQAPSASEEGVVALPGREGSPGRSKDMYASGALSAASAPVTTPADQSDAPRAPFLVYRERAISSRER